MNTSTGHDQLSAITSQSTYNGWCDLTPECGHIENPEGSQRRFMSQHSYDYISSNWAKRTYLSLRVDLQL